MRGTIRVLSNIARDIVSVTERHSLYFAIFVFCLILYVQSWTVNESLLIINRSAELVTGVRVLKKLLSFPYYERLDLHALYLYLRLEGLFDVNIYEACGLFSSFIY